MIVTGAEETFQSSTCGAAVILGDVTHITLFTRLQIFLTFQSVLKNIEFSYMEPRKILTEEKPLRSDS